MNTTIRGLEDHISLMSAKSYGSRFYDSNEMKSVTTMLASPTYLVIFNLYK